MGQLYFSKRTITGELYHDFEFGRDDAGNRFIRVWRHYGIGDGLLISNKYWENKHYQARPIILQSVNPTRGLWNLESEADLEEEQEPELDHQLEQTTETPTQLEQTTEMSVLVDEGMNELAKAEHTMYQCPEESCSAEFMKWGNLQKHILRGKHKPVPLHENLYDHAMKLYGSSLETITFRRYPDIMEDAVENLAAPQGQCQTAK